MTAVLLRPVVAADLPAVLELNQAHVPHVGHLGEGDLEWYAAHADWFTVAVAPEGAGQLAGFLIGFGPGAPYTSPNYRFFAERYRRFAYVDRVAVVTHRHGEGVGRMLYEAFAAWALARGLERLCAEVNLEPRNERSLAFHERNGFVEVGQQVAYDRYLVSLLVRELEPATR